VTPTYGTDAEYDDYIERRVLARELAELEREPDAQEIDDRADREAGWR